MLILGSPGSSDSKESACNAGDPGLITGSGRSPEKGNGLPIPIFLPIEFHGPEKPGRPTVHGIAKSWTQLIDLLANKETENSERLLNLLSHD